MPDEGPAGNVLDELIEALVSASGGSRELDVRLDYGLGVMLSGGVDLAGTMIREGITWQTVSEVIESRVPAYTTSRDAAVEGENVVFVLRSDRRGRWGAMHRARCGREVLAWAATEPLARRLAALEGLKADQAWEREHGAAPADAAPARDSAAGPVAQRAAAGQGDWKILF